MKIGSPGCTFKVSDEKISQKGVFLSPACKVFFFLLSLCHVLPCRVAHLLSSRHTGDRGGCPLLPRPQSASRGRCPATAGIWGRWRPGGPRPSFRAVFIWYFYQEFGLKNMLTKFVGDTKLEGRANKLVDKVSIQN